jgi:putative colanic acid biosynthesis UDP-glucose lipid carrier transferase
MADVLKTRRNDAPLLFLLRLTDPVIAVGAAVGITTLYHGAPASFMALTVFAGILTPLLFALLDLYKSETESRFSREAGQLLVGWTATMLVLGVAILAFEKTNVLGGSSLIELGRHPLFWAWAAAVPATMLALRLSLKTLRRSVRGCALSRRRALVLGADEPARRLLGHLEANACLGYEPLGILDDLAANDEVGGEGTWLHGAKILGAPERLAEIVDEYGVEAVLIPMGSRNAARLQHITELLGDTTADAFLVPDISESSLGSPRPCDVAGLPAVALNGSPCHDDTSQVLKWIEDKVFAALIILMISPILATIAVAIKLDSRGPVIFRQKRHGFNGELFTVFKFRTMSVQEDGCDVKQACKNDPRVTKVGAFLRRTSLDELPQFFNVLTGGMSIVGPRPHAISHTEMYRKQINTYMHRLRVKPGITGWAQINGYRGETQTVDKMRKRIEHDLYYIRNWSLLLDLKIIIKTAFTGFSGGNAY